MVQDRSSTGATSDGIRIHNPSVRAVQGRRRLRQRDYWGHVYN
jgi:hypothetical protein